MGRWKEFLPEPRRQGRSRINKELLVRERVTYLGMTQKIGYLKFELLRSPQIVLIEKREELSAGGLNTTISRRRHALICLVDVKRVVKTLGNNAAIIYRTIVHYDHFKGSISLGEDALQRVT